MPLCASRFAPVLLTALCAALLSNAADARSQRAAQEPGGREAEARNVRVKTEGEVESLRGALLGLSPTVSRQDAARAAARALETARDLKRKYGVAAPPQFHNFLVNAGIKRRGLCHQWTHDLIAQLGAAQLKTLDLHWGIARAGTLREHNSVVVTARGQPFGSGIVLDPWRGSGRLYVGRVAADRYPWSEDLRDCLCERKRRHDSATARALRMTASSAPRDIASSASRSAQPTR